MNHYAAIEQALIAKINAKQVIVTPATETEPAVKRSFFARVDTYQGERGEEFLNLSRQAAPSLWLRCERSLNQPKEFEQAMAFGQPIAIGATQNRELLTWSIFALAKSLRSPAELREGGPGVVGVYDILDVLIGAPGSPASAPGQLRGFQPIPQAEPLTFRGWEILGQSTFAVAVHTLWQTRMQL
jgi:hypothetical protein